MDWENGIWATVARNICQIIGVHYILSRVVHDNFIFHPVAIVIVVLVFVFVAVVVVVFVDIVFFHCLAVFDVVVLVVNVFIVVPSLLLYCSCCHRCHLLPECLRCHC